MGTFCTLRGQQCSVKEAIHCAYNELISPTFEARPIWLCESHSLRKKLTRKVAEKRYFPSNFIFLSHSELYSHNNKIAATVFISTTFYEEEIASNRGK